MEDGSPDPERDDFGAVYEYQNRGRRSRTVVIVLAVIVMMFASCYVLLGQLEWTKGRPLRGRKRRRRPRKRPETGERAAAACWRAIAADEYESIASFSELALDLMAAGAPTELVRRCHQAALEEDRHTTVCLDIARRLDGQDPPPPEVHALARTRRRPRWRTALLTRLAVESYVDGCIGEASSAWTLAQLGRAAEDPHIRDTLRTLAREETGHATLGRDIVHWCCENGGPTVRRAVALARTRVANMRPPGGTNPAASPLRSYGVPDDELRAQAFRWALRRERAA